MPSSEPASASLWHEAHRCGLRLLAAIKHDGDVAQAASDYVKSLEKFRVAALREFGIGPRKALAARKGSRREASE